MSDDLQKTDFIKTYISVHIKFLYFRSYFGPNGINYSMLRLPMGGTDFSTRPYSYAMTPNDTSLEHFELQMEDIFFKVVLFMCINSLLYSCLYIVYLFCKTNNMRVIDRGKCKKKN